MGQEIVTQNQVKKTLENQNPIKRLGQFSVKGGPGRPKGLKNKHTLIKQEMLEVWIEEHGKERFRELFRGTKKDFIKALEKIIAVMPKELDEIENVKKPQTVVYQWLTTPKEGNNGTTLLQCERNGDLSGC